MQKAYPAAYLRKLGVQIKSFGALVNVDEPAAQKNGANTIVVIPVHFEKQNINVRYIVNQGGLISGMFLLPGGGAWQRARAPSPRSCWRPLRGRGIAMRRSAARRCSATWPKGSDRAVSRCCGT